MSVGNAAQVVNFDRNDLTLVLGENLDLGGNGSKNGVGKTTILNALSYAFYGQSLSDIRVGNLVNKSNDQNMIVTIDFEVDGIEYRIERGRKPNILRFFRDNSEVNEGEDNNDARGENKETQAEIETLLKMSHEMFKQTVGLNTYTTPFLALRVGEQRTIIEQLLGITVLSEKAEKLKEALKFTKESITEEEFRVAAILKANQHIEDQIDNLKRRQRVWVQSNEKKRTDLADSIEGLMDLDVDGEIQIHKDNAENKIQVDQHNAKEKADVAKVNAVAIAEVDAKKADAKRIRDKETSELLTFNTAVADCNKWITKLDKDNTISERRIMTLAKDIDLLAEHKCHACGQDLHDDTQEENKAAKDKELDKIKSHISENIQQIGEYKVQLAGLGIAPEVSGLVEIDEPELVKATLEEPKVKKTFYKTVEEAHSHKSTLETLTAQLETAMKDSDPYAEQIVDMNENGLQNVTYDDLNDMVNMKEHQTFLLKLLTSKDSFIRMKIIEQNLAYLNNRLTHYLSEIGLPHIVRFMPDLSVEITEMGRELDFGNLSRGERTRLILSLSWAFRDVWESLFSQINLVFVDELIDNGLDAAGLDSAVKIMKSFARDRGKSVWLVSHKEELTSRVNNTMMVVKTGGFTEYSIMD